MQTGKKMLLKPSYALLIHEIYVHGYTSGHATLLLIIAHASNLFLVF